MAKDKDEFVRARRHADLSPGGMVRVLRALQEMSQNELAEATGIAQPLLSGIEHGRYALGLERAKKIARALKVHPGVLLFADWDEEPSVKAPAKVAAKRSAPGHSVRRRSKVA